MESLAATKCAVGEVRTGWVEAEEFVEDDLELEIEEHTSELQSQR